MADTACSEEKCARRPMARGLCSTHYNRLWKTGNLPEVSRKNTRPHTLSRVDVVRKRADCARCGPDTRIRVRPGKHPKDSKIKLQCGGQISGKRRKEKYGLNSEDYQALVARHDGRCAICDVRSDSLNVDHCHSTGRVRGLLCGPCNRGIGLLQDDAAILRRAAEYLS